MHVRRKAELTKHETGEPAMPAVQTEPAARTAAAVADHVDMHVDAERAHGVLRCNASPDEAVLREPLGDPAASREKRLRFAVAESIILAAMKFDYDVVIIGGAFSGAATALLLKRKHPAARILIIEKDGRVRSQSRRIDDRSEQLFHDADPRPDELSRPSSTGEAGIAHVVRESARPGVRRLRGDRRALSGAAADFSGGSRTLDTHMLDLAVASRLRTAAAGQGDAASSSTPKGQTICLTSDREETIRARWLVDASGRAAMLARKLGHFRQNTEHPINAVWARFSGVKDWDSYEWRERFPDYANACRTARNWATNHLMGHGWWCWIIPLKGGDVSAGIVYDSRIFKLDGGRESRRAAARASAVPSGRARNFRRRASHRRRRARFFAMPYSSAKVCGEGWASVGDAAGFIDPLYSPGLDFCSYTSFYVADMLATNLAGEDVSERIRYYNEQYPITYRLWFETLYKDKYYYMGDAELMSAALLLDVGAYFVGLVTSGLSRSGSASFSVCPSKEQPGASWRR